MPQRTEVRSHWSFLNFFHAYGVFAWGSVLVGGAGMGILLGRRWVGQESWQMAVSGGLLLLGVAMIGTFVYHYIRRIKEANADAAGLTWSRGGRVEHRPWEEVESVYRVDRIPGGTDAQTREKYRRGHVRIVFRDATQVQFDRTLTSFAELEAAIQVLAAKAGRARKETEALAGGTEFGPITLSRTGLRVQHKDLAWADLNYAVYNGDLCIAPAREDFAEKEVLKVNLETVPNYAMLFDLMERVGKPMVPKPFVFPPSLRSYRFTEEELSAAQCDPRR